MITLKGVLPHDTLSDNFLINCNTLSHNFYQKRTPCRIIFTVKGHPVERHIPSSQVWEYPPGGVGPEPLEHILAEVRQECTNRHLVVTKNCTNGRYIYQNTFLFLQKVGWCLPGMLIVCQYHEEMGLVQKLDGNGTNQLHLVHAVQGHLML